MVNLEWEIKCEHRIRESKHTKQIEINRLKVIINLYKEKLTSEKSEAKNLLVELKVYNDKIEVIASPTTMRKRVQRPTEIMY